MASIDPVLKSQMQSEPDKHLDLIVITQGQPRVDWMEGHHIQVRREYRLKAMAAITCTGAAALELSTQDWVISIEADRIISAL